MAFSTEMIITASDLEAEKKRYGSFVMSQMRFSATSLCTLSKYSTRYHFFFFFHLLKAERLTTMILGMPLD